MIVEDMKGKFYAPDGPMGGGWEAPWKGNPPLEQASNGEVPQKSKIVRKAREEIPGRVYLSSEVGRALGAKRDSSGRYYTDTEPTSTK